MGVFECPGPILALSRLHFTPILIRGTRKATPLPGWEQRSSRLGGPIHSAKQCARRWGAALRQRGCSRCGRFVIQVGEYLPDHRRVFDTGDYPDETGIFTTCIGLLEGLLMAESSSSI